MTSRTLSGWGRPAWNRFQCPQSAGLLQVRRLTPDRHFPPTPVADPGLTPMESSQLAKATPPTGADSHSVSPIQQMNRSNSGVYFAIAAILAGLALVLVARSAGLF